MNVHLLHSPTLTPLHGSPTVENDGRDFHDVTHVSTGNNSTSDPADAPPGGDEPEAPPTPWIFRFWLLISLVFATSYAFWFSAWIGPRGQAFCGIFVILGLVALFSSNINAVQWRPLFYGFGLQVFLALFILKFEINGMEWAGIADGTRPGFEMFRWLADLMAMFLQFSQKGMEFVFGVLVNREKMREIFGRGNDSIFAVAALPTIIFVSSFFSILYYFGILQFVVRVLSRCVMALLGTSGAETLSAVANVFMGQTEAPLVVKPFVPRMTRSELLALMVGGMATISGSLMAIYIGFGADRVAILATSVMAAPCSLYLTKLLLPETEKPLTLGVVKTMEDQRHRNVIDAAATGATEGMKLVINVAAMLIAFIALIEFVNALLRGFPTGTTLGTWLGESNGWEIIRKYAYTMLGFGVVVWVLRWPAVRILRLLNLESNLQEWKKGTFWVKAGPVILGYFLFLGVLDILMRKLPTNLTLGEIFATLFYPLAILMGVRPEDAPKVASLLGTKLATNEFVAFLDLIQIGGSISQRSFMLATYALTGFANFASIGIQLGAIGAMAPERRADLARLGPAALFVGFLVTILNAAIVGVLLPSEVP